MCWSYRITCDYYPACPEPELTLGHTKHSDIGFITILLQNQISGLQVLYQDQWVDIQPIPGAIIINIGDLLQLVSNGRFVSSSKHRVVANSIGPRIYVANFFSGPFTQDKYYGPIKELISEESPARFGWVNIGLDNYRGLDYYKL